MENESWAIVSKKIERIRKSKGLSQEQLSEMCGKKQGSFSRTMANNDVKYSTVLSICKALNIELKELL